MYGVRERSHCECYFLYEYYKNVMKGLRLLIIKLINVHVLFIHLYEFLHVLSYICFTFFFLDG